MLERISNTKQGQKRGEFPSLATIEQRLDDEGEASGSDTALRERGVHEGS